MEQGKHVNLASRTCVISHAKRNNDTSFLAYYHISRYIVLEPRIA